VPEILKGNYELYRSHLAEQESGRPPGQDQSGKD
jgi:hypothetical protein